jgi:hypothetical protein
VWVGHLSLGSHKFKYTFMGFNVETKGGNFALAPVGNHVARCYGVIDLGHQMETFQGKEIGERKKALFLFEFPTKLHVFEEGKPPEPFTLSIKVTNSLGEKSKLRPMLESWTGSVYKPSWEKSFSIDKMLGKPCMAQVSHKEKQNKDKFAKIVAVTQVPDGLVVPPPIIPTVLYSVDQGRNDPIFKTLKKWIQEECNKCTEWQPSQTSQQAEVANGAPDAAGGAEEDGDDPF